MRTSVFEVLESQDDTAPPRVRPSEKHIKQLMCYKRLDQRVGRPGNEAAFGVERYYLADEQTISL
jgi:hypothetical protein